MPTIRSMIRGGCCLLAWLALAWPVSAVDWDPHRAAEVEAAYVVNFARYTDWPAATFEYPLEPLVIGVVGPRWLAQGVRIAAAASGGVRGRPVEVVNWRRAPPARLLAQRRLHLLFIDASTDRDPAPLLAVLAGRPVLTVGNGDGFVDRGGMLGLVRSDRRIGFNANPPAIRAAGLTLSSKVLKMAERLAGEAP